MSESPPLSPEQRAALADEIAAFAARADIAEHALLTRLRTFDAHEAWADSGFLSTAQWLAWRTHIGPNAAREKVRVARALGGLPRLDAAFGRSELSYSKVRAITRVATAQSEQHFIDVAQHATASQIERLTRAYKRCREFAYLHQQPRTLGSAYELVILTTKSMIAEGRDGVGGFLRDGTPIPHSVVRRIAGDAARVDAVVDEHGELLDVGRRTRSIPSAIGRALWLRDGGCRVPGCGRGRHLHGHHIEPWAEGGATSLDNLTLVCSSHHRMIHEGKLACELVDGKIAFVDKLGRSIPAAPPMGENGHDLEELELFLRDADLHMDPSLTEPRWDGRRMDLGDALAWMFMAAA